MSFGRNKDKQIVDGTIRTAISLGLGPEKAGEAFEKLSENDIRNLEHLYSRTSDTGLIALIGRFWVISNFALVFS